jgi:GNAT superfamily N-acetyltransferase
VPFDAATIAQVINAAFVVERVAFDGDRVDLAGVRSLMDKGKFLLAETGDDQPAAVGCVYLELRGKRCYLGLLCVEPSLQGTGLGRRIMAAAEQYARAAGCVAIDLRIISPRADRLRPFYQRLGYRHAGEAPFPAEIPSKVPIHYVMMTKPLGPLP